VVSLTSPRAPQSDVAQADPPGARGPLFADLDQAFLLLCAANLAYGVSDDSGFTGKFGVQPPVLPDLTTIENLLKRLAFRPDSIHAHQSRGRDGIDAYLYGETEQAAILAFRGTLPLQSNGRPRQIWGDWINSTRMALVDGLPFGIPGKIHEGFAKSLANLWEAPGGLASHLERMAWAHTEGRPLLVTGHSKGGALALLAAMKLANLGAAELTPAAVVSFGAPRAGNASFAAAYQAVMGDRTWRVEYRDDLVPHLPPPGTLWKTLVRTLLRGQESVSRPAQPQEEDYVAVGQLHFIDWARRLRTENTGALHAERWLHLLRILAQRPSSLIHDHLPMSGCGYMDFLKARQEQQRG
jgi:hypothetical protein